MKIIFLLTVVLCLFFIANTQTTDTRPALTEVWQPEPRVTNPGRTSVDPPSDAKVLFNGKDLSNWQTAEGKEAKWKIKDDYVMVAAGTGNISTKMGFGDCQLHIEWKTPDSIKGNGQARGNSGIFLMGRYELQVLDSYRNRTYSNGQAGSMYKQAIPLVNVCRKPGEWQTYDIIFTAPRFNPDSTVKSAARITVLQNGVLIQNNVTIWGGTEYIGIPSYKIHAEKLPLILQDHGDAVCYRNIWIREL